MAGFILVRPKSISVDYRIIYEVHINTIALVLYNGELIMVHDGRKKGFCLALQRGHPLNSAIRDIRNKYSSFSKSLKKVGGKQLNDEAYRMVAKSILQEMNTLITGEE